MFEDQYSLVKTHCNFLASILSRRAQPPLKHVYLDEANVVKTSVSVSHPTHKPFQGKAVAFLEVFESLGLRV